MTSPSLSVGMDMVSVSGISLLPFNYKGAECYTSIFSYPGHPKFSKERSRILRAGKKPTIKDAYTLTVRNKNDALYFARSIGYALWNWTTRFHTYARNIKNRVHLQPNRLLLSYGTFR